MMRTEDWIFGSCSRRTVVAIGAGTLLILASPSLGCSKPRNQADRATATSASSSRNSGPTSQAALGTRAPSTPNCKTPAGTTSSVALFEVTAEGKYELVENAELFPLSEKLRDITSSMPPTADERCVSGCMVVAARPDLDGDGRADILAYIQQNSGSSGDYPWFAAKNCSNGQYRIVLAPTWVRQLEADTQAPRDPSRWLKLLVTQSTEGFKYVAQFGNHGAGYADLSPEPPRCPEGLPALLPSRLYQYHGSTPGDSGWFLAPHPPRFGIAQILSRPDLNGDGMPDLLLDFPTQCSNCPKAALVACGGDWYVPVLRPRTDDGFTSLVAGPKDKTGWRTLIGTSRAHGTKSTVTRQTMTAERGQYVCPPYEACGTPPE